MSFDINNLTIVGRLTADPVLSYTQSQKAICKFSIANGRGKDEVNFFDVITWEKVATACSQYCKKGSQVVVSGKLQQNRFQDKTTGANRSKVEIVGINVQFIGGKSEAAAPPPPPLIPPSGAGYEDTTGFDDQVGDGSDVPF